MFCMNHDTHLNQAIYLMECYILMSIFGEIDLVLVVSLHDLNITHTWNILWDLVLGLGMILYLMGCYILMSLMGIKLYSL